MTMDKEYPRDEKTVLFDREGHSVGNSSLTDAVGVPRVADLETRMVYAARLVPDQTFNIGLNPLVAAASTLLSEVIALQHSSAPADLLALNKRLQDRVHVFATSALHKGIAGTELNRAQYLLCSVIDEAVVVTPWGNESEWSQMSLLSRFHNETFGGEKFFQVLHLMGKDPAKNLFILELIYLCLSLGFEGKYRLHTRGAHELEEIRDSLYRQIRQVRGDVLCELSPQWEGLNQDRRRMVRIVPAWIVVVLTLICLAVMYSSFTWVLTEQRNTVLQPYKQFDATADSQQPHS